MLKEVGMVSGPRSKDSQECKDGRPVSLKDLMWYTDGLVTARNTGVGICESSISLSEAQATS